MGNDNVDFRSDELICELRSAIALPLCVAEFDSDVAAVRVTEGL
jgi:hypothetical protein